MSFECIRELGRECAGATAVRVDLVVRLHVRGKHRRDRALVVAVLTFERFRLEMVAQVQFEMMTELGAERTQRALDEFLARHVTLLVTVEIVLRQ